MLTEALEEGVCVDLRGLLGAASSDTHDARARSQLQQSTTCGMRVPRWCRLMGGGMPAVASEGGEIEQDVGRAPPPDRSERSSSSWTQETSFEKDFSPRYRQQPASLYMLKQ